MISFDRSKADVFFSMLKSNGFYVDIGVRDGIHDNKTYLLYKNGWHGISIDAHPDYVEICKAARPEDNVINIICGKDDDNCKFRYNWRGSFGTIFNEELDNKRKKYVVGSSGGEKWYGTIDENKDYLGFKNSIEHSTSKSLNTILETHNINNKQIDVLSIDVDGAEKEILTNFDIKKYNPSFVCIEIEEILNKFGNFDDKHFIFNYMEKNDYILLTRFTEDYIWVNSENYKLGAKTIIELKSKKNTVKSIETIHPCNYFFNNKLKLSPENINKYINYINSLY